MAYYICLEATPASRAFMKSQRVGFNQSLVFPNPGQAFTVPSLPNFIFVSLCAQYPYVCVCACVRVPAVRCTGRRKEKDEMR